MNSALINLVLKNFGGKISRSLVSYAVAFFAAKQVIVSGDTANAFVISTVGAVLVILWSMLAKIQPKDAPVDQIKDFVTSLGALVLPGVIGWLNAKGIMITGNETADAATLILLRSSYSHFINPDSPANSKGEKLNLNSVQLLAFFFIISSLTGCAFAHGTASSWTLASLGTDVNGLSISAQGMTAQNMNQSDGLKASSTAALKLMNTAAMKSVASGLVNKSTSVIGQ